MSVASMSATTYELFSKDNAHEWTAPEDQPKNLSTTFTEQEKSFTLISNSNAYGATVANPGTRKEWRVYTGTVVTIKSPDVVLKEIKLIEGSKTSTPTLADGVTGWSINYDQETSTVSLTSETGANELSFTFSATTYISTVTASDEASAAPAPELETMVSVEETKTLANDTKFEVGYDLTVGFVNGKNVFACDEDGDFIQIYNTNTYKIGDTIKAGWIGSYSNYQGTTPEITNCENLPEGIPGTFVPEEATFKTLKVADVNRVVLIKDVTVTAPTPSEKTNFEVSWGESSWSVRNNYGLESVPAGVYDIVVVVTVFQGSTSLYVTQFISNMQRVETPVITPETGTITKGTVVTITCPTEGASIYYTIDGTDPTAQSTAYTSTFEVNADMTVKAIAVKEGMLDSAIAQETYTVEKDFTGWITADFNTFNGGVPNNSYGTYTTAAEKNAETADAWVATYSAILSGQNEGSEDSNPRFSFIGNSDKILAPTLVNNKGNGGTLTSPVIKNGINGLAFNYGFAFADTAADLLIEVIKAEDETIDEPIAAKAADDNVVYSKELKITGATQKQVYQFYVDGIDVKTSYKLRISNTMIDKSTSKNIERVSIWDLKYLPAIEAAISTISTDANEVPVYYNLQGMRVNNPENGIYIMVKGNKTTKVAF